MSLERIRSGNLAEYKWVVDDGCKEINRLDQGEVVGDLIHPCVVAGFEPNEKIRISRPRKLLQEVSSKLGLSLEAQPAALDASVSRTR